jgi:putative S-adenosyl-L-methionine-dependent methyltransferase
LRTDTPAPFSRSRVWDLQRAYYEREATEAFAQVPHQIVDNPYVARAFARAIVGFVRDCARGGLDPAQPLYVVELGAGAGRFAHGCVRELGERLAQLPLAVPELVYVMTDLGEATLGEWAANPGLEDERLDFARFDATADMPLELRRRGTVLERSANPMVLIANYVFDSLPADAFAAGADGLEELLVAVEGDEVESMRLDYTRAPVAPGHYGDPDLDALLAHYGEQLRDTVFTVPRAALQCIRRARELAGGRLLVLSADKAFSTQAALYHRHEPEVSRHGGAFSLMVNFHALGLYARNTGGDAWNGGDRHDAVDVLALAFGAAPDGHAETGLAYADAIDAFSPDDLFQLAEGAERAAGELTVAEIVALLRLSHWDAFTLHGLTEALVEKAPQADAAVQEDLRAALFAIADRHFAVPGDDDLPFAIGRLMYEMGDYEDALDFFEQSIELYGPHPATEHNIKLCEEQL